MVLRAQPAIGIKPTLNLGQEGSNPQHHPHKSGSAA